MKNFSSYLMAGVIGGAVAGGIMWLALKSGSSDAQKSEETSGAAAPAMAERAPTPRHMRRINEGASATRAEMAGTSAQPDMAAKADSAGETSADLETSTGDGSETSNLVGAQQGSEGLAITATEAPRKIDIKALPRQVVFVEDVLVPVPSEVFAVLDKIGKPNWREVMRPLGPDRKLSSREQIALLLGTVIADGFIAVEAEDSRELQTVGQNVLKLSDALGVRKAVVRRSTAIMEAADEREWARVRKELDGALADVRTAMLELDSAALAQLVSLGGWLRGTEALASVVLEAYTQDAAELLHQPLLVDHFNRHISSMPEGMRRDALITELQQGLTDIRPLMGTGATIPESAVQSISRIAARLVGVIGVPKR